jgi:hypothetical protein
MLLQQRQAHRPPYTKVLSALRKTELVRLCIEFRLSIDGSVVTLRNRLKDYLNLHRDALFRNPRYKPLFPKHRRANRPPSSPVLSIHSSLPRSPSALSYVSSVRSYASWNGIDDHFQPHTPNHSPEPPHLHHDHPHPQQHHSPPPSPTVSFQDPLPPVLHAGEGRKYLPSLPRWLS